MTRVMDVGQKSKPQREAKGVLLVKRDRERRPSTGKILPTVLGENLDKTNELHAQPLSKVSANANPQGKRDMASIWGNLHFKPRCQDPFFSKSEPIAATRHEIGGIVPLRFLGYLLGLDGSERHQPTLFVPLTPCMRTRTYHDTDKEQDYHHLLHPSPP